jgi:ubiquinone/menaquinone biosynthesis C-methylase UbiE
MGNYRLWDQVPHYGDTLYKRATGELDEMESSKSLARFLKKYYQTNDTVLDVGCGAGHYLRSLRAHLDPQINYTGADATEYYIHLARKAYPDVTFFQEDIHNLSFKDAAYDMVLCNNVILHLPAPPSKAISELMRVAKKYAVIRTLMSESTYIIKRPYTKDELVNSENISEADLIDEAGEPVQFGYFNMYNKTYIEALVKKADPDAEVTFFADNDFQPFDNPELKGKNKGVATTVVGNRQISGNLLYDWHYIVIEKKA